MNLILQKQTFIKKNRRKSKMPDAMKTIIILLFMSLLGAVATNADAQSKSQQIKGKIIDNQGQSLIGVVVTIKETKAGTVSDIDGYYVIDGEAGQTLVFTYMGFTTIEKVVPPTLNVDVVMEEDVKNLDEVVVVGMGTQRKASVIGSISTVKINDLKTPSRSLTNALGGRLSGVVAVQRSGEPGNDKSNFWIRGISTFGENKTPLILVDGVERDMDNLDPEAI